MLQDSDVFEYLSSKGAEYKAIDIQRFPRVFQKISSKITQPKIVHIIGTNAKGSTGRTIAHYLNKLGKKTLHYSSPHIFKVNERIWVDGESISDEYLQKLHEKANRLLSRDDLESLSYFEYLTLLMIVGLEDFEYGIIEAGLGGEFDATNVLKKNLSIITPIGLDHKEFLGDTIEMIATTKINSVKNQAIIANQTQEVLEIARKKVEHLYTIKEQLNDEEQLRYREYFGGKYSSYLVENILVGLSAIKLLGYTIDLSYFEGLEFFGRYYQYKKNIIIDVGHNELAAQAISKELQGKKIHLIYNTYKEKDYKTILNILKPNIIKLLIINIINDRILPLNELQKNEDELVIEYEYSKSCESDKEYLVFGSFAVIEGFVSFD